MTTSSPSLRFRLLTTADGDWASFVPMIGGWSDERLSIARGDGDSGLALEATARPVTEDASGAPQGPGIFALRWFWCAADAADEFVALSAAAWPAFEAGTPGTRIFGLFKAEDVNDHNDPHDRQDPQDPARFLLCTRYPSLAAWESSRTDTTTPDFRRRAALTRRTQVTVWRLRPA